MTRGRPGETRPCAVAGCWRLLHCRGWCDAHYQRWKKYGDPQGPLGVTYFDRERFVLTVLARTAPVEPNGCILWPFPPNSDGYAGWKRNGKTTTVGRMVLEHFVGPPPTPSHTMGHAPHDVCGNRHCIAPAHLSWQTALEQAQAKRRDGHYQRWTHCKYGHEFTPENTYIRKTADREWQTCRECHRLYEQRRRDHAKRAS